MRTEDWLAKDWRERFAREIVGLPQKTRFQRFREAVADMLFVLFGMALLAGLFYFLPTICGKIEAHVGPVLQQIGGYRLY